MLAWYQSAFGAQLRGEVVSTPDGKSVMHAMLDIGASPFMAADVFWPGWETGLSESTTVGM